MEHVFPEKRGSQGWSDFLTPEQRLRAVAEIMAEAALRVLHQKQTDSSENDVGLQV